MNTAKPFDDLMLKVGSNQIEILEFWLYKEKPEGKPYRGVYGINVSKVIEVIRMETLTEVPNLPSHMIGMIQLRGQEIPVVDLAKWLSIQEPQTDTQMKKIIIAEFNNTRIGFVVHQTTKIRRIAWGDIKVPPALINEKHDNCITGTTMLDEHQILLLLDLEKIVADMVPRHSESFKPIETEKTEDDYKKTILVVDDSLVARNQIIRFLKKTDYEVESAINGKDALQRMEDLYNQSQEQGVPLEEVVYLVLTDVEMPEMDGYTLSRILKEDQRFREIPVVMHSSLSGTVNIKRGREAGCDDYIVKFDPKLLYEAVSKFS